MYDIIGDIHGYAGKLKLLLEKLGYKEKKNGFQHPNRRVIFVGDYIDGGPQIPETLNIVKTMVDQGNAIAVMGNHEFNAICFHMQHENGGHLREHSIKNITQHCETIKQFKGKQQEYDAYIEWLKTLPLFFEDENLRVVHACWDNHHIKSLQSNQTRSILTEGQFSEASKKHSGLFNTVEILLKGKEVQLPDGVYFKDKEGHQRREIRVRWWENPEGKSFKEWSVIVDDKLPEQQIAPSMLTSTDYYKPDEKPVFFGHYWMQGTPALFRDNICCLDYSVANKGKLVAYRFNGESRLSNDNFVFV